jgi:hypothetical protein
MTAPDARTRALTAAGLFLGAWAGLWAIDAAIGRVQRRDEAAVPRAGAADDAAPALPPGRVLVLLIDSWRAESAEAMPSVRELLGRALFVHVDATQDAATVPSLRAAFSGQTQRSLFAFGRNFVRGHQGLPSIFSQLAEAGGRAAVFSDGAFYEIAPGAAEVRANEEPPGDEETRQRRAFEDALTFYRTGVPRLVVFHLTTVDHVAHWHAVGEPAYQHAFDVADALVREAVATIDPLDTLVVMGDHGHDESGRHFPGLRVPTVALYLGARFSPGLTLGPVPLTIHRYLLSWALGLPLSPQYRGTSAPNVLAGAVPPAPFWTPPAEVRAETSWRGRFLWLAPLVGLLALASALGAARWKARGRWSVALAPGLVIFFVAWGAFLAHRRAVTRPPVELEILVSWALALAAALALTWRGHRRAATWLALGLPTLLLYPSAAWDGWGAVMGPAWIVALAALALDWMRRRRGDGAPAAPLDRATWLGLAALPLLAAFVLPFIYADTDGVVTGDWRGYLTSNRLSYWIVISATAKLVLFVRPRRGTVVNVVALGLVAMFSLVSFGGLWPSPFARLAAAAFLTSAAFATRGLATRAPATKRAQLDVWKGLASIFATAALLMLYRATVVLEERSFLQLEVLLAALRLSSIAATALAPPRDRRWLAAWLEAMAVLVAAWTTLALTLHRLEWSILYRFLSPPAVEANVVWLVPVIVGRYAIPLVLARRLLAEARPPGVGSTWPAARGALGAKLGTLVLMTAGSAILNPASEPFRVAVQTVLTLSVLALALAYEPRTSPA